METIRDSGLLLIMTEPFGLTEEDVGQALQEANENLQSLKQHFNDPYEGDQKTAVRFLSHAEDQVRALSASPTEVLTWAKTFYGRAAQLASSRPDVARLTEQLDSEFPDLWDFSHLLFKKPWGLQLGIAIGQFVSTET
ncbi:MAG: hypothetical protein AAB863_03920 [Patescibacteria group bacterium]